MSNRFKIILIIVFIIAVAGAVGFYMWNKPHKDVKDATAIKVTANELYNSFIKDSAAARTKYLNKIVEVTGVIADSSINNLKQKIILLNTAQQNASINCTMEGDINNIIFDHTITLKGICNGYNGGDADLGIPGDVILVRCYVAENN
ncbi:OB-fold putative lipoprotein [Ferruginibacter albus]|uniref:OB-fold putative lipoprotein n=1 Tax=Ferruginibacter albus TaxID=2875540 RepID=UPI001CC3CCC1|nr:OB-fold putative lipoprotein [Ferruginibacter albus]UAY52273.1 OB-fold putative lipoprotein [Ferruginibacter albus]